jgi:hypothetical protein
MIQVSDRRNRAFATRYAKATVDPASFRRHFMRVGLVGAAVLLCLIGTVPGMAQPDPDGPSARTGNIASPTGPVGGKAGRLAGAEEAARAEERIEQAFADIPRLEIALRRDEPPIVTIPLLALRPPQAAFDLGAELLVESAQAIPVEREMARDEPAPEPREPLGPEAVFALALREEERMPAEEELAEGYLTALAPLEQSPDVLPQARVEAGDEPIVALPDAADLIPTPTPRPPYSPVARLTPQEEPERAEPARPAQPELERSSPPARAEPEPEQEPEARPAAPPVASRRPAPEPAPPVAARQESAPAAAREPTLPKSLLPTRPPASVN